MTSPSPRIRRERRARREEDEEEGEVDRGDGDEEVVGADVGAEEGSSGLLRAWTWGGIRINRSRTPQSGHACASGRLQRASRVPRAERTWVATASHEKFHGGHKKWWSLAHLDLRRLGVGGGKSLVKAICSFLGTRCSWAEDGPAWDMA